MYEVIGLEVIDYVNKQNKRVQGVKVHCSYPNDNCEGICTDTFYIKLDKFDSSVTLGSIIEPMYNRYGQVQSIHIIQGKE